MTAEVLQIPSENVQQAPADLEPASECAPQEQPALSERPAALEQPPLNKNQVYAFGAVAAVLGIAAGLAFANLAGRSTQRNAAVNPPAANSNAASLATLVPATAPTPVVPPAAADANPDQASAGAQPRLTSHRKPKKKDPDAVLSFAIEGDDQLVEYDPAKGIIRTSTAHTFFVNGSGGSRNLADWGDGQPDLHYRCGMNASCVLTRRGAPTLYAQLKR